VTSGIATTRDPWGVPHLVAGSAVDLARLQGRTVALDRTWQIEHARLEAEGRTASRLGATGLPWDRIARRMQLEQLGRRGYDALDAESAALVDAFVAGVNEGLAEAAPVPELVELDVAPGRWSPWTPLAVFAARHLLFGTFPSKLWRHHVERHGSPGLAGVFHHEGLATAGSNSWVVGGARTASGLPMVGGDPHRSFESPNVYQQVRLTCTDPADRFDVAGFTFPGVPGVQHFAHAGTVAWGITNAMADYQDVYLERLTRRGDEVWAEGPSGAYRAEAWTERIEVRDGPGEEVEVITTANGPVLTGGPDETAFTLRTASWVTGDLGFGCLLPLLRARTADDVVDALGGWVEPVNNLVVADVHGRIRQAVVGRVPARADRNRWRPVPGWSVDHRWTGWLDPLPSRTVPADGHLVTANHRMNAEFDVLGVDFAPPGRARRIDTLLGEEGGWTREAFTAIHRDVLAGQPALLADAVARLSGLTPQARALQEEIGCWDQRLTADSPTAAAYIGVRDALVTRLAAEPPFAGLDVPSPHGELIGLWFDVPRQLQGSLESLLSDAGRRLVPGLEGHLGAAVEAVAADRPGRWGARHRYRPLHVLGHRLPTEPELPGDNDCVRCAGGVPGSDGVVRGSVARYVWDLAGMDHSGWVVPLGASGNPADPHHHDQLDAWVEGRLLPVTGTGR
jgi:penicillin G amidase